MTDQEKLIDHVDDLINSFNDIYRDFRQTTAQDKKQKKFLCRVLMGGAFGIAQDFNEIEKCLESDTQ